MSSTVLTYPSSNGWYWVLIQDYDEPTPCWFCYNSTDPDDSFFLPGGLGDRSSCGLFLSDLAKIGPKFEVPNF